NRTQKYGRGHPCKECKRLFDKDFYQKNRAKKIAQTTAWGKANPDKKRKIARIGAKRRRQLDPGKSRANAKRYGERHPEKVAAWRKKCRPLYKQRYPHKIKAVAAVGRAIRNGILKRQECLLCKKFYKKSVLAQAHHSDYRKPLEVIWLCPLHHSAWHRVFKTEDSI
ncbi:MAG TPA: hypothetical protein VLH77_00030, partial [Gammaproteobacteria bacterium]|nr:hypothetical protein [Gammaproteobacteria bacterium]